MIANLAVARNGTAAIAFVVQKKISAGMPRKRFRSRREKPPKHTIDAKAKLDTTRYIVGQLHYLGLALLPISAHWVVQAANQIRRCRTCHTAYRPTLRRSMGG